MQEARSKLGGKSVEDLGWYNPHTNQYKINKNRVDYWIGNGAQPTEIVGRILKKVQTSEAETYPTRDGRKKKKGSKVNPPEADVQKEGAETPATPIVDAQTQTETEETPKEEGIEEEVPKEAHAEASKEGETEEEKAPTLPQDFPEKQSESRSQDDRGLSTPPEAEQSSGEVREETPAEEERGEHKKAKADEASFPDASGGVSRESTSGEAVSEQAVEDKEKNK